MIVYYNLVSKDKAKYDSEKRNMRAVDLLKFLESGPKTFGQIQEKLDLWPATLNRLLDDLVEDQKIQPVRYERKAAYAITKKGKIDIQKIGILGWVTNRILEEGGIYFEDYSKMQGTMWSTRLAWETTDDLILDKNLEKINPITRETAKKLQEVLYRAIKEDVKKGKIKLDNTKDGRIVLGFHIGYKELVKSIFEQSLEYLDSISERELDLLDKMEDESITKAELEEFEKLRKATRAKLGATK
jgi:predicted transcriptional regulator